MKTLMLALLMLIAGYLAFWPVPIDPVSWKAPKAPPLEGVYAINSYLANVQRIGTGIGKGPEDVLPDGKGYLYTGYADGRIVRMNATGDNPVVLADTQGRPLGLALDQENRLIVADADKGLLRISNGNIEVLATQADGTPFGFTNNVDIARDGRIFFTDASSRYGMDAGGKDDILEHGGHGRLMVFSPDTMTVKVLLDGLQFANGVALAPDESAVLVAETGAYRIRRYWLEGVQAGTHDIFIDNLPGFPDNLSSNGTDTYWLALYAPRNAMLDAMSSRPFVRKIAWRLPEFVQPQPAKHAMVLGLSLQGDVIHNLQHQGPDSYYHVTGVREWNGWLWLGNLDQPSLAAISMPPMEQP